MKIFHWIKLSWHSCSMWDKLGCLNWFWQFICDWLSSCNPRRFCHVYAWSCSLCEGRTSFCTGPISRKLSRFLLMFSTGFTWFSVLHLFPLSITFIFMPGFGATLSNIGDVVSINPSTNVFETFNTHH